jgi:hypothetical protein
MKQRALGRRLEKLNFKFLKTKTELAAAKRRASSTRLAARAARQAQRIAKKKAHAARDAARVADSVLNKAARAFSKASARLDKMRKKLLKAEAEKTAVSKKGRSAKAGKPSKSHHVPAPPFPISSDKTSASAIARATAVAAKRGALQRPSELRTVPSRNITTVAPLSETNVAAAS